jgi:hypothetical protein
MSENDENPANRGDRVLLATNSLLSEIRKIWAPFDNSMAMEDLPGDDVREQRPSHHWEFRRLRAMGRRKGKL